MAINGSTKTLLKNNIKQYKIKLNMKDKIYIATTTDEFENILDLADTLKELCQKNGISYTYCKKNTNKIFYNSKNQPIFIKKIDLDED